MYNVRLDAGKDIFNSREYCVSRRPVEDVVVVRRISGRRPVGTTRMARNRRGRRFITSVVLRVYVCNVRTCRS